ncbi:histidinol-phosphate transaminase [uncultured Kriegella sp.]|uniref:histidinol-phosphate transaminase n=1 Tax=uncultured Kriegella sp. TaxID=1798910 RepID=UPI0030D9C603
MKKEFSINNFVRENVKGLKPYSSARDEYISDGSKMVFLDANENPYENGVNRYPDPQQRGLKAVLAAQKGVEPQHILLGNGSDEVLDLLFRAFCEPKEDNVISLPPTYGMYKVLSAINNIENREVLLTPDFQPDVDAILQQVDIHTKMIFLCSPNNPTGNSFSSDIIKELLECFQGLVVIDEAYIDFSSDTSWTTRLAEYPNLIVTQTLSKAYGMAGIRLGICVASSEIINVVNKIKPPYNVNELTQQKAFERVKALDLVEKEVGDILAGKKELLKVLKEISFIEKVYASDANFVLAKVDNADTRYQELLSKGIVVRNRTTQPLCENTLRFTIGTKEENEQLIAVLRMLSKE